MGGEPERHPPRQLLDAPVRDAILCIQVERRRESGYSYRPRSRWEGKRGGGREWKWRPPLHTCPHLYEYSTVARISPAAEIQGSPSLFRSTELTTIWLETFGISLAFTFVVVDVIVIVVRNNLSCTKAILATRRYQLIEKFVVAPAVGIYRMLEGMLCKLLC